MNKAYKKKLKKLYSSYKKDEYVTDFKLWYCYFDIDGDGVDEMFTAKIFASGFDNEAVILKIYKYADGKLIDMTKKIDVYATDFYLTKDFEYLITEFQGDSYEGIIYKRSGNYFKKVAYYFDGEETVYEVYDKKSKKLKEVSESEFNDFCNKYLPELSSEIPEWALYE